MPPAHRDEYTSAQKHWAAINEKTSVLGLKILLGVYRLFGRIPFTVCLGPVLLFYWMSSASLRRTSLTYLSRLNALYPFLPGSPGHRAGLTHLMRFAETILDKFLAGAGVESDAAVLPENDEIFANDAPDRGAVILTAHVGCQELLARTSSRHTTHPIVILQHTAHAKRFNALLREASGIPSHVIIKEVTQMSPAVAVELSELVQQGAYIIIAGDRVPIGSGEHGRCSVDFLGYPASLPIGGALLSILLKCPLRQMICVRDDECRGKKPRIRYRVRFESLSENEVIPRAQRQVFLKRVMQRYADNLVRELARSPYDWFNFFDFWHLPDEPAKKTTPNSQ